MRLCVRSEFVCLRAVVGVCCLRAAIRLFGKGAGKGARKGALLGCVVGSCMIYVSKLLKPC